MGRDQCNNFQINESLLNWVFNTTLTNKKLSLFGKLPQKVGVLGRLLDNIIIPFIQTFD